MKGFSAFRKSASSSAQAAVSHVASTVNHVGAVVTGTIPGLRVYKNYELGNQVASGGAGGYLRLFAAKRKGKPVPGKPDNVCVWLLDKRILLEERKYDKKAVDSYCSILKLEAERMLKLKHPGILQLLEAYEESKHGVALVTEPVFASVSTAILKNYNNIPRVPLELKELDISMLEIQYGVLQVVETLAFLHSSTVNMIHRGICPDALFITPGGRWKIGGFGFSTFAAYDSGSTTEKLFTYQEFDGAMGRSLPLQPQLAYVAPELVAGQRATPAVDMFSMACTVFELYSNRQLIPCNNNILSYKSGVEQLSQVNFSHLPSPVLQSELRALLSPSAEMRPSAAQFASCSWFTQSAHIRILKFMEDMVRKEPSQKAQFLSSLSTSWREIPERLLILQVIPHLLAELRNEQMRPLVLPILLAIAETQDKREFERVLPFLIKLMAVANGPTLVLFVQSSPKLQNKMSPEAVERHLYPLLIRGCDSPEPSLQTEAAKSAVISAEKVAYTTIRQTLLPRLHNMATKSPEIRVRVTALTCMANLSDRMDKPTLEAMVTSVKAVLAQSSNAGGPSSAGSEVTMAVVEVLQNVAKHGGVEFSCSHVLPVLCPVLIYPGLQPGNFQLVMQEIRNILAQVESKQGAKIEEQVALKAGAQAVQEAASGSFNLLESNKASIAPNHSAAWDNVSNLGFGGADKTEHRKSSSVSSTPREPMLMQQNEASLLAPAQAGPSPTYQPLQIPLANDDFASGVNLGSTPSNSVGATTVPAGMNTMFHGMSLAGTAVPAPPMAQPAPGDPGSDPFAAFPDTTSNAVANADLFAGMDAVQPSIPVQPTTSTNDLFGGMQMQPGPSPTNPTSIGVHSTSFPNFM